MVAIVLDALAETLEPNAAAVLLERALEAEKCTSLPSHPSALRLFVTGSLRRVAVEEMGLAHFDAIAADIGRRVMENVRRPRSSSGTRHKRIEAQTELFPETARERRLLVVSADEQLCSSLTSAAGTSVVVSKVESLLDVAPLLELEPDHAGAVIVDALLSPIAIPTLAQLAHVIPASCPVLVLGCTTEAWSRLRRAFPTTREWRRLERVADLSIDSLWGS